MTDPMMHLRSLVEKTPGAARAEPEFLDQPLRQTPHRVIPMSNGALTAICRKL